jgi:hypothetical protein
MVTFELEYRQNKLRIFAKTAHFIIANGQAPMLDVDDLPEKIARFLCTID